MWVKVAKRQCLPTWAIDEAWDNVQGVDATVDEHLVNLSKGSFLKNL